MDRPDPDPELPSPSNHSSFCFCFPCFGSRRSYNVESSALWERIRTDEIHTRNNDRRWWVRVTMKVREWSEIAAGPKWKNFIRRFNKNRRRGGGGGVNFQYDPLSYALNFDEDEEDEDIGFGGLRSFSTRYAGFGKPVGGRGTADDGLGKSTAAVSSLETCRVSI